MIGTSAEPSRFVGPYHLLQKIGEGGMGEVWQAEQTEPVRRRAFRWRTATTEGV